MLMGHEVLAKKIVLLEVILRCLGWKVISGEIFKEEEYFG